jgi:hypothetical protein
VDCSWYRSCERLHSGVEGVISGAVVNRAEWMHPWMPQAALMPHEPNAFTASACGPHVEAAAKISDWRGERTGFQFAAVTNALRRAACCAGVAILPSTATHPANLGNDSAQRRTCFDFSRLPRVSGPLPAACLPHVAASSDFYFRSLPCPTTQYYLAPALAAAAAYVDAPRTLPCPLGGVGAARQVLLAVVRGGDIFRGSRPHGAYGQPRLAFYLAAWRESRLPRLLVVSEDDANPVVAALRDRKLGAGERLGLQVHGSFDTDLAAVMCARHLVLARSTLTSLYLTNPGLKNVYAPDELPAAEVQTASCDTRVWVPAAGSSPLFHKEWDNSPSQRRWLVEDQSSNLRFRRQHLRCFMGQPPI